jgi:hypothetical protein
MAFTGVGPDCWTERWPGPHYPLRWALLLDGDLSGLVVPRGIEQDLSTLHLGSV